MRILWRRSLFGYDKEMVLQYVFELEAAFALKEDELSEELERLNTVLAEAKGLTLVLEPLLSPEDRIAINKTASFRVRYRQDEPWAEISSSSPDFRTVLFGLGKRNVMMTMRRIKSLQQEQLQILQEKIVETRYQSNGWLWKLAEIEKRLGIEEQTAGHETSDPGLTMIPELMTVTNDDVFEDEPAVIVEEEETQRQVAAGKLIAFPNRDIVAAAPEDSLQSVLPEAGFKPAPPKPNAVGTGFWEDADAYLEQALPDTAISIQLSETVLESSAVYEAASPKAAVGLSNAPSSFYESGSAAAAGVNWVDSVPNRHITPPESSSENIRESVPAHDETGSAAVSQEIRDLRSKYIVGKIAGEDLFDVNGRLIVAKNHKITLQALLQAEQNGKLAELIVNMLIPGLGDA